MIQIALIGVPPVFTHGHSFGWHEYFLAKFFQGLNFRGLPNLLEAVFFLLGAADYLALMAAALKFGGFLRQSAVNGLLAPAVRWIPTESSGRTYPVPG